MLLPVPVASEWAHGILFPPWRVPPRWSRTIPGNCLGMSAEFAGVFGSARPLVPSRLFTSPLVPMPRFVRQAASPIEAFQWFPGQRIAGLADEVPGQLGGGALLPIPPHAFLTTRRGRFTVFGGDWVITEPTGEQHVCPDHLFQQNYLPMAVPVVHPRRR